LDRYSTHRCFTRFKGEFKNNLRDGRGEWKGPDGAKLIAEWSNGKLSRIFEKVEAKSKQKGGIGASAASDWGMDRDMNATEATSNLTVDRTDSSFSDEVTSSLRTPDTMSSIVEDDKSD